MCVVCGRVYTAAVFFRVRWTNIFYCAHVHDVALLLARRVPFSIVAVAVLVFVYLAFVAHVTCDVAQR